MIPTRNHSSLFLILVFNPRDLYFLGVLKEIIILRTMFNLNVNLKSIKYYELKGKKFGGVDIRLS